jgi:RNA polymerase-binding transcription factor DksA
MPARARATRQPTRAIAEDDLREVLLERRVALMRRISKQSIEEQEMLEAREPDVPDRASEVEIAGRLDRLSALERAAVEQIDAALARLTEGAYGRCSACSSDISDARLSVIPETTLCWDCAINSARARRGH